MFVTLVFGSSCFCSGRSSSVVVRF